MEKLYLSLLAVCLKLSYFAAIYKTAYHNDKSLKLSHDEIKLFFKQCNHVRMNQSFCFLCSIVVSKAELSLPGMHVTQMCSPIYSSFIIGAEFYRDPILYLFLKCIC